MWSLLSEFSLCLPCILPDMRQTHGRVKPVEYGQGDGDVDKDGPGVLTVDTDLDRIVFRPNCLERIHNPHTKVTEKQKCYKFSSRFSRLFLPG